MLTLPRAISLAIALTYVALELLLDHPRGALLMVSFSLLPLACIWWPDAIGSYTGLAEFPKVINRRSPGSIVAILGWVLLSMPLWIHLILWGMRVE